MTKILIVGAGPVGLSAALWLKLKQFDVEIIDTNVASTPLSKAIGINSRSLELFEEVGLSARMIAHGNKLYAMNFRHNNRILLTMDFAQLSHRYNFILALPQATTEMLLLQALAAERVNVAWQHKLIECHEEPSAMKVIIDKLGMRHIKHFDYCIGADGAHSTLRSLHHFTFKGKGYPDHWNLVDLVMDWPYSDHEANVFLHNDGVILFVAPLGHSQYRLVANTEYALEYLPLGCQIEKIIWQSNFTVQCRQVDRYQKGRIFLAGDAAHVHSPAGGRGMNLGFEDAYVLADMLAAGDVKNYSANRYAAGTQVLSDTDRIFRIASLKNPIMRYLRDHVLFDLFSNQAIQKRLIPRMAGLKVAK